MDEVQPPSSHPELLFPPEEVAQWEGPAYEVLSANRQITLLIKAGELLMNRIQALPSENIEAQKNYHFAGWVLKLSLEGLRQLPWAMQTRPIYILADRANIMAQHLGRDQTLSLAERHRSVLRLRTAVFLVDREYCNAYSVKYGKWRPA